MRRRGGGARSLSVASLGMRAHVARGIARFDRALRAGAVLAPLTIAWRTIDTPDDFAPAVYEAETRRLVLVAALAGGDYRRSAWYMLADALYALMYPGPAAPPTPVDERVAAMEQRLHDPFDACSLALSDHGAWAWLEPANVTLGSPGRVLALLAPLLALVQRKARAPDVDPRAMVELDPLPAWLRVGDEERATRTYFADMAPASLAADMAEETTVPSSEAEEEEEEEEEALLDALEYHVRSVLEDERFPLDPLTTTARQAAGLTDEGGEWLY